MEPLGCLGTAEAAPELPPLDLGALAQVLRDDPPDWPVPITRIFWPHYILDEFGDWPADSILDRFVDAPICPEYFGEDEN